MPDPNRAALLRTGDFGLRRAPGDGLDAGPLPRPGRYRRSRAGGAPRRLRCSARHRLSPSPRHRRPDPAAGHRSRSRNDIGAGA